MVLFAGTLALFGIGLLTGVIECERRCVPGWGWLYGGVFVAFGLFLMYVAITRVPNVHEPGSDLKSDPLRYRREDWDLAWGAVLAVLGLVGIGALLLWLAGVL